MTQRLDFSNMQKSIYLGCVAALFVFSHDLARLAYMVERSADWLKAAGARDIKHEASNFAMGSTHLHGTCRAGDDPRTSVVDRNGKLHSLDNVYVADGSYMPYPGGVNPTLTIQANALRIARLVAYDATGRASPNLSPLVN